MNPKLVAALGQLAWRHRRRLAGLIVMGAVGSWLVVLMLVAAVAGTSTVQPAAASTCVNTSTGVTPGLAADQAPNARVIVTIGQSLGVPVKGLVIAVATALQESELRNVNHGDRDSLGLFQQRPSTGWGTPSQVMDPRLAALAFYGRATHTANRGLLDIPRWQTMPVTVAAQAVQGSGFPDAYAKWEAQAVAIVSDLTGGDTASAGVCDAVGAGIGAGPWRLPLPVGAYTVTSGYGVRVHPTLGILKKHAGVDLAAAGGTPVTVVHTGRVTFAGTQGSYGNIVIVDHGGGISTAYAHLSAITTRVGAAVPVGTVIGRVGSTGRSTGNHLHLEVRTNGTATDPVPWLRARGLDLESPSGAAVRR
ncbi:MAG: M23 family metallopeptidase [Phycicoccus sp.]